MKISEEQLKLVGKEIARRWRVIAKDRNTTVANMIFRTMVSNHNSN